MAISVDGPLTNSDPQLVPRLFVLRSRVTGSPWLAPRSLRLRNERQRAECHLGAPKPANDQQVCPVVVHARC